MRDPSVVKVAAYRKAFFIGLLLTLFQLIILIFFVASRTLGADTVHSAGDLVTLGGTAWLLGLSFADEKVFRVQRRKWLLIGVWSLAFGGLFVAGESISHLLGEGAEGGMRSTALLVAALGGALGNWFMHRTIHGATHEHRDALDKNNLDHMFWDGILSFSVFLSFCFGTPLVDGLLAIAIGTFVLPYLAWKRWKESEEEESAHEHGSHDEHHH